MKGDVPCGHFGIIWLMRVHPRLWTALCLTAILRLDAGEPLRSANEIMAAVYEQRPARFDVEASVVWLDFCAGDPDLAVIGDRSGHALVSMDPATRKGLRTNDVCKIAGRICIDDRYPFFAAYADVCRPLRTGPPFVVKTISGADFLSGRYDACPVLLRGQIDEVIPDEIDVQNVFLILQDGSARIPMNVSRRDIPLDDCSRLVGREATVQGLGMLRPPTTRRQIGRTLSEVKIVRVSSDVADPFLSPPLSDLRTTQPEILTGVGRHKAVGSVLANWDGGKALIKTDHGHLVRLECSTADGLAPGQRVEAVGYPETDLYTLILTRAMYRPAAMSPDGDDNAGTATEVSLASLLTDETGKQRIQSRFHGQTIRIRGIVRTVPSTDSAKRRVYLQQEGFTLPIDISALTSIPHGLDIGCEVKITAVAVLETEKWRPNNIFPKINELLGVVRSPDDIVITKAPSWWTTGHLLAALGVLASGLLVIAVWNILLQRLVERRSRELAIAEITRAKSDLKTVERTCLAIELHDALSQNLTAVSMEIETAQQFLDGASPALKTHLNIAEKALDSCRSDLRNCLWDLRNAALEAPTLDAAVQKTLIPHVRNVALSIRFDVPRERLSDSMVHTILCIIRELAANAVQHGHAAHVDVVGRIDDENLVFSVRDDGVGFDCARVAGIAQGHFGLQGIRERVQQLGGSFDIVSRPHEGTKGTVTIPLPQNIA